MSYMIMSEPLADKKNSPEWKKEIKSTSIGIIGSRNNYKDQVVTSFKNYNIRAINNEKAKLTEKEWSKYLQITYKRLEPIRDFIALEIEKEDIPFEILYLPIVESAAHPMAVSQKGATGLWQFMENSSKPYNMTTNYWIDERRDFIKSTKGAISKIKYNYKETGDWLLAIAAYNCGLNRVKTVVKTTGIKDYWELSAKGLLPKETIKYIPKLIAISSMLQDKNRYNIPVKWDISLWDEIEIDQPIDLRTLSLSSGIALNSLKKWNSELNYDITPSSIKNYKLKVPTKYSDIVVKAISDSEKFVKFHEYKIKSGDTLYEIANLYGVTTNGLIKYNPGVSPRALKIGYTLIVPVVDKM